MAKWKSFTWRSAQVRKFAETSKRWCRILSNHRFAIFLALIIPRWRDRGFKSHPPQPISLHGSAYRVYVIQNLKVTRRRSSLLMRARAGQSGRSRKNTRRTTRTNAIHLCHVDRSGDISRCLIPEWNPQLAIAHPFEELQRSRRTSEFRSSRGICDRPSRFERKLKERPTVRDFSTPVEMTEMTAWFSGTVPICRD